MKYFFIIIAILVIIYAGLWVASMKRYPMEYGISFNQEHATSLGLDWKDVYADMLEELKPKYIRISAMWSEIEKTRGVNDFDDIDWMMDLAAKHNTKVILVVGQKAPRWPECHIPGWLNKDDEKAKEYLLSYVRDVVERYRQHPALEIWQVENEPFIRFLFGECGQFNEKFVLDEINLVGELDLVHPIIITDSGELSSWREAIKIGDYFGTTLYRTVGKPGGGRYSYNWLPPSVYRYKAMFWGQDLNKMFISELQAEPWFTTSNPDNTPLEIQEQTMNPDKLKENFNYAERVGVKRAYLWGVEWWYWAKEARGDSRYWDMVKEVIGK